MRLLILGGTGEARQIAQALAPSTALRVTVSLAGATRNPVAYPVPTRIGGFGGAGAFADWLTDERVGAVLDATHPFAARMSHRAAHVCNDLGLPRLQLLRPAWLPGPGDNWTFLNREEDAARHIEEGATVFLATGRENLEHFANLAGRRVICRQIETPDDPFPFENGQFLVGRPPFHVPEEVRLFRQLGVDWLVVKNAGGAGSRPKLDAARELGLPVGMIRRPYQPQGPKVETVAEALNWVRRLTG